VPPAAAAILAATGLSAATMTPTPPTAPTQPPTALVAWSGSGDDADPLSGFVGGAAVATWPPPSWSPPLSSSSVPPAAAAILAATGLSAATMTPTSPTQLPTAPTQPPTYDCEQGFSSWQVSWTAPEKTWCCIHHARGCDLSSLLAGYTDNSQAPGGAAAEAARLVARVSPLAQGDGTWQPPSPSPSPNGLQAAGGAAPAAAAPGAGAGPQMPEQFSCSGLDQNAWPAAKKLHCCIHEGVACPPAWKPSVSMPGSNPSAASASMPETNPDSGMLATAAAWAGGGASSSGMGSDYDCEIGLSKWTFSWSPQKQSWCCAQHGYGCDLPSGDTCVAERTDMEEAEKQWCCSTHGVLCEPTTTRDVDFDCHMGTVWAWTPAKTSWCCEMLGLGCITTTPLRMLAVGALVSAPVFDCSSELAAVPWSSRQIAWCCVHAGRGCGTLSKMVPGNLFDCHDANAWTIGERQWCCENLGAGCDGGGDQQAQGSFSIKFALPRLPRPSSHPGLPSSDGLLVGAVASLLLLCMALVSAQRLRSRRPGLLRRCIAAADLDEAAEVGSASSVLGPLLGEAAAAVPPERQDDAWSLSL